MAEDLSNTSMAALLTEFTELVQNTVKIDMPREKQLEQMTRTLEGVTNELTTYCSSWKTATQQAEDAAKQIAGKNEELEETRRQMAKKNEELEERRKQTETQEELLSRKERLFENKRIDLEKKEEVLQRFQSTMTETLQELTGAVPKAQADAQCSLLNYDVSRFEEIRAKRGLGHTSTQEPPPKRRRYAPQSSVEVPNSSSMDPTTATRHIIIDLESSSPGTLIQSSQSAASATDIPALSDASDEVKQVWAHIDFPANWDTETSKMLLNGLNKNTGKKLTAKYRPAGLLNSAAAHPICLRRKLAKVNPAVEPDDSKCCSDCKARKMKCVSVSYVAEDLADVEYDEDGEDKRWKLTIRED